MARAESVQLVERDVAGDQGTDAPIAIQKLPAAVLAALRVQFPGAALINATFSSDDGPEFDLTARFADRQISVAFQPDGGIMETSESVSVAELSRAVVDWVTQNISSAHIVEAALVTKGDALNYELVVGTSREPGYDISLRVLDANPSPLVERPDPALPKSAMSVPHKGLDDEKPSTIPETARPDRSNTTAAAPVFASGPPLSVALEAPTRSRIEPPTPHFMGFEVFSSAAIKLKIEADFLAGALRGRWADGFLPGRSTLAAALAEVVPIDLQAAELKLQQAVKVIDSLVGKLVAKPTQSATWRLALLGVFITAGQLMLRMRKQNGQAPVLVRSAANSSWSWVIGTPAARRRQA